jgi:hypothetical protein
MITKDKPVSESLSEAIISTLEGVPGVVITTKLNSTNFTVKKKVFAFTKGGGVVLKLPPATVKRLVSAKTATLLVMGKRTMKEWVVIRYRSPRESRKHLVLFKEAMDYVSSQTKQSTFQARDSRPC